MILTKQKEEKIQSLVLGIFEKLNKDPERIDTTERTGVYIVIRDLSIYDTEEYYIQVKFPSLKDIYNAIRNTVLMEEFGTPTSADLAHKEKYVVLREMTEYETLRLQGAITYINEENEEKDTHLHVSVCGMKKPSENVAIAVIVMAEVLELPITDVLEFIMYTDLKDPDEGNLPSDEVFYHLIQEYEEK